LIFGALLAEQTQPLQSQSTDMTDRPRLTAPLILALAAIAGLTIVLAAFVLRDGIDSIKHSERFVSVRGVAEKDVKADLAIWPLRVRVAGNDLAAASQQLDAAQERVVKFLVDNGIAADTITRQNIRVTDKLANDYNENAKATMRYALEAVITVRSKEVDKVLKASQQTNQLAAAGIVVSSGAGYDNSGPQFLFTGLNSIKPAMLADATKSAREGASKFAADSGSKVGNIRRATQGLFTINDRDQALDGEGRGGDFGRASGIDKRVRVVVTVEYTLD
jgi:hypothetical protein